METFGNQPQIVIFRILLREIQGLGPQQQIRRHQVLEPCVRSERAHVDPYGAECCVCAVLRSFALGLG